ncbi:MAG: hypothetical protein ACE5E7_12110 [Anaerolineae bacterium]
MTSMWANHKIRKDLLWIAAVGLAIQAYWALRITHPTYFDAYYYTVNGQQLASGNGFTGRIIWQYLDDPAGLPTPSHTYWMPLASMIAAAGFKVTGSFRGAQFSFWLMAGFLPWLSYAISWRLSPQRWQARTAALFTAAGGYYTAYWVQPTTFVLFAWTGGGGLLTLALALERRSAFYWFLAGLAAGLSHLTRADGILLAAVGAWVWLLDLRRTKAARSSGNAPGFGLRRRAADLAVFMAGYLLVMSGWFWRTWLVTGQPLSTVGAQTMFLTTYNDVFAFGRHFDLAGYLAWGWQNILLSKLEAVWLALQSFVGVTGLTVFTLFFVWAWISYGRRSETRMFLRPFTWYALALYGSMSLIFTFPGQRGSLLHSSTALWPWSMALAAAGIGLAVEWAAARLPHWQPQRAKVLFSAMFVAVVYIISMAVSLRQPLRQEEAAAYREISAMLPPDVVVMSGNPPGFTYHTGLASIAVPYEPLDVVAQAAKRYGARYLFLDVDRPPPLADLYDGKVQSPQVRLVRSLGDGFKLYEFVSSSE